MTDTGTQTTYSKRSFRAMASLSGGYIAGALGTGSRRSRVSLTPSASSRVAVVVVWGSAADCVRRCRAIEDTVRRECADMPIADVLSVGTGHPRSALIVETTFGMLDDATARGLAEELSRRITEPCEALFPWERIDDPRWIIVVEKGRLLRNKVSCPSWRRADRYADLHVCLQEKGNLRYAYSTVSLRVAELILRFRRGANEELFKSEIDALFTGSIDRCRRAGR